MNLTASGFNKITPNTPFKENVFQAGIRRVMDVSISLLGLLLGLPLAILIILLIKRDSPGPIYFRGNRVGKNGRIFKILKFRTMYEDQNSYAGPSVTAQGDPRITPIGQWLRDTKLNELPQLWNVLKGDMSLVGPRPEDPEISRDWPPELRAQLLSVRPGITSPASIIYRNEEQMLSQESLMDDYLVEILPSKLRLDSLYIRNRTILSDLDVLLWTVYVLIPQARKFSIPESSLYWGPFSSFVSRFATWFAADAVVSLVSIGLVGAIWRSITPLDIGWRWAPITALAMASVFSITNYFFKTHLIYWKKASPREVLDLAFSTTVAVIVMWLADRYLILAVNVPDGLFLFAGLVAFLGFITIRYRERILTGLAWRWLNLRKTDTLIGEPILIVGAGELGEFAAWLVRKSDLSRAFSIIGIVDDDPRKQSMRFDRLRVLGTTQDIPQLVETYDLGLVLYAISNIQPSEQERILQICEESGVRIVMIQKILTSLQHLFRDSSAPDFDETPEIMPAGMVSWLDELEALAATGDLEAIEAQIQEIRSRILEAA